METNVRIYNIEVENKYYDWDDPRYDVNEKIKSIDKEYEYNFHNIDTNDLNYELADCLEEIGQEYCNSLCDTTLDDIIIYCEYVIIMNNKEEYHKISYDYSEINSIQVI